MKISVKQLLEAGVHFGHQTRFWHPKMASYIFGQKNQTHIINLEKTLPLFKQALDRVAEVTAKGGRVLFVGTKWSARRAVREHAQRCGMPYVNHRWLGGMLTNYKTIRQSIRKLREYEAMEKDGSINTLIKKEALNVRRRQEKMDRSLGGIKDMGGLPDMLFVLDVGLEKIAIREAKVLGIPVVGIVDTNHNPEGVDFVIPGNDDAIRAIDFYMRVTADTILAAKEQSQTKVLDEYVEVAEVETDSDETQVQAGE